MSSIHDRLYNMIPFLVDQLQIRLYEQEEAYVTVIKQLIDTLIISQGGLLASDISQELRNDCLLFKVYTALLESEQDVMKRLPSNAYLSFRTSPNIRHYVYGPGATNHQIEAFLSA